MEKRDNPGRWHWGAFENENILFECKVFCDCDIFCPVKSSLTLKLSTQKKPNRSDLSFISPLGEGICWLLSFCPLGKLRKVPGPGPRTPDSLTVWGLKRWNRPAFFPQGCSVRNSPHLLFTEGPSAVSENKSRCWIDSVISTPGWLQGWSKWKHFWSHRFGFEPQIFSYKLQELRQIV